MDRSSKLRKLSDVTAYQWGIVTSAQAAQLGVTRLDLSRFADNGHLVRLAHGVYRDAGAPEGEFDELRAAWLSSEPGTLAENRKADSATSVIVANESAAVLHRIGDFRAEVHDFVSPVRRQTQRTEIRYRQRQLEECDVTIVSGLPVMTIERTISDLIDDNADLSLVADALRDASEQRQIDEPRLAELLAPLAARNGFPKNEGRAFLEYLKQIAGIDDESRASRIARERPLAALVSSKLFADIEMTELAEAVTFNPHVSSFLESAKSSIAAGFEEILESSLSRSGRGWSEVAGALLGRDAYRQAAEVLANEIISADFVNSIAEGWSDAITKSSLYLASPHGRLVEVMEADDD